MELQMIDSTRVDKYDGQNCIENKNLTNRANEIILNRLG